MARPAPNRLCLVAALALVLGLVTGCAAPQPDETAPSQRCATCHLPEYRSVTHPPHPGIRPQTCGTCHLDTSWHPDRLEHSWPLEGAHAKANCFACHSGPSPRFEGTSQECLTCHRDDDDGANRKVPGHERFGTACQTCHSPLAWKPTLPHPSPALDAAPEATHDAPNPVRETTANSSAHADPTSKPALPRSSTGGPSTPRAPKPNPTSRGKPDSVSGASPAWRK